MVKMRQIIVKIKTGDLSGAGTNGKIHLGIEGREFRLDKLLINFREIA
jgi:hypothetical protein